ncbi:Cc8K15.2-like protein, partial [Daphnia magna]
MREKFIKPDHVVVHWDTKLIKKDNGEVNDRIAILMSGFPQLEIPKLLDVPVISDSTGSSQHVFDTTSSNTDRFKGCATCLEKSRGCAVLWFTCRHHVFEIHVQHVAKENIGKRNQPSETLIKRYQKESPELNQEIE